MRLEWSPFALEDRDSIFDYIEQDNPRAAVIMDERLHDQTKLLMQFPECGRPGRIEGTRELFISSTHYIAAYQILGDTIRILRVLHSAQLWPKGMSDT